MNSHGASSSDNDSVAPTSRKESKRPKYSKFTQQELPACKPLLTPGWVITIFMVIGIIFIPIGAISLLASNGVVEIVHRYETSCIPNATTKDERIQHIQSVTSDKLCLVSLTVPKKMSGPVYVYYELDDFYQNHRRYVKSRNDKQLRGDSVSASDLDSCKPEATLNGEAITPCGLIAWSLFNDTYQFAVDGAYQSLVRTGISWKSDREQKFGNIYPSNFPNNGDPTVNGSLIGGASLPENQTLRQDEDLIVWMRTAALPTFRKLWGKIERDFEENQTISVTIANQYNTYTFGGKKKLVLSTTSWLGGKNSFLGIAYFSVGGLCILLALVFFIVHHKNPRALGDPAHLSWNKRARSVASSTH